MTSYIASKKMKDDIKIIMSKEFRLENHEHRFYIDEALSIDRMAFYTPLQKKRNTWFRSSHDPNLESMTP